MGDADNETLGIAQEFEAWMNETTDIVEEGLNNVISLTMELERRTKRVRSEYKALTSMKRFFFAFNVVVIPVVLALLICYMVRETFDGTTNGIQNDLQPVIGFLMFLSGAIGVPCYVYSIFEHVCDDSDMQERILRFLRLPGFYRFPPSQFSEERLDELVRVLRDRIPEAIRSGTELRTRFSEATLSVDRHSPRYELRRLSSEILREPSPKIEKIENKADPKEKQETLPSIYELQLRGYDQSPDLEMKIEQNGKFYLESPVAKPGSTRSAGFLPVQKGLETLQIESFENSFRKE